MTAALEGGEWSAARPGCTLPAGKTRYPLYRRLGGPQSRSGWAENLVPTGIRSRTAQPVAQSLYQLSYRVHAYLLRRMQYVGTILVLTAFSVRDSGTTQTPRHLGLGSPVVLKSVYNLPQGHCVLENMIQTFITRMTVQD